MRIGSSLHGLDLTAQNNLRYATSRLALHSLRLSTLQRIDNGSDDPSALIAVGLLQSELAAGEAVLGSAALATGIVRVADSALAGVGSLMASIRANVLEVAGGTLSEDQIAAKQLEVDAALEAINRIGQSTSFAGQKLFVASSQSDAGSDQVTLTFNFSVDANQPSTLTLPRIDTSSLGGAAGHLSDLASDGTANLGSENWDAAIGIVDSARDEVLDARAAVGAFQRYTIESSQTLMEDMQTSLGTALSALSDTDVAIETSRLIQSEILARMSLSALSIASQRHQIGLLIGLGSQDD
jgi:flagellin